MTISCSWIHMPIAIALFWLIGLQKPVWLPHEVYLRGYRRSAEELGLKIMNGLGR